MNLTWKSRILRLVAVVALVAAGVLVKPLAGQSTAETETNRLLKGAVDMHFHMDPPGRRAAGWDER